MEPPVSYPASDSYQGRNIHGRKSGCMGKGCFGFFGLLIVLAVIAAIGYFFALPALMPNSLSGTLLDAVIVDGKNGEQKLWVLTDGSFNFIQTTESPGKYSTGRECYFCKTYTYIINPKDNSVEKKIKTPYDDIIIQIDLVYHNDKVWSFTRDYGENPPRIEAFDSETGEKIMTTEQFIAQFPELKAGLTSVSYNKETGIVNMKTTDGLENLLYRIEDGKLYDGFTELRKQITKDTSPSSVAVLAPENSSSGPRKKLYVISGPKNEIENNRSSLENYAAKEDQLERHNLTGTPAGGKIYLEGIMYYSDQDCAVIIYLDQLGKKSGRIMTCVDLKTGKEMWTVTPDELYDEMKIDENDDAFSSLFFTKSKIDVKRSGNLVILKLKGEGIMGFDYKTGKKLWELDI